MADITENQKIDLLAEIRLILPDAEYAPGESWRGGEVINFQDHCGCYSEWTTESCSFDVTVSGTLPKSSDEQWTIRQAIESRVEHWVKGSLSWSGCSCCAGCEPDEYYGEAPISVNAYIFQKKSEEAANA